MQNAEEFSAAKLLSVILEWWMCTGAEDGMRLRGHSKGRLPCPHPHGSDFNSLLSQEFSHRRLQTTLHKIIFPSLNYHKLVLRLINHTWDKDASLSLCPTFIYNCLGTSEMAPVTSVGFLDSHTGGRRQAVPESSPALYIHAVACAHPLAPRTDKHFESFISNHVFALITFLPTCELVRCPV